MNLLARGGFLVPAVVKLVLAVAFAQTMGCAHGGIGSSSGWSLVKSSHFSIYTLYPRDTQLLVRDLELAYASLGSTFFKNVSMPRVDVLAFTPETFEQALGFHRRSVALAQAPGGGTIGKDGLIVTMDDKGEPLVAEALAHLFIHKTFGSAPLWFHEGFAGYTSTVQYHYGEGKQAACFGVLPREKEPLIPMGKLLTISWDDYDGDQGRGWYHYTSRLLVDFIMHGADGKNSVRLRPLIEAVELGKPARESLEAAFPAVALEVIDRKLAEHAADVLFQLGSNVPRRGLCPLPARIPPERAADESKPEVTAASDETVGALFQALLKLPRRDGYPRWYPPDVVARAK